MSKKDLLTTIARDGLIDPQFPPTSSNDPMPIGNHDVTDATNDISLNAKLTLGAYLHMKTTKNEYPISFDEGTQSKFVDESNRASNLQSSGLGLKNVTPSQNNIYARQQTFFEPDQLSQLISKDHKNPSLSGNKLLENVPFDAQGLQKSRNNPSSEKSDNLLLKFVHEQLVDGNMYSPDAMRPFIRDPDANNEKDATRGLFTVQRNLGSFDINGKVVQVSDMTAMALSSLLRSADDTKNADIVLKDKSLNNVVTRFLRTDVVKPAKIPVEFLRPGFHLSKTLKDSPELAKAHPPGDYFSPGQGQREFLQSALNSSNLLPFQSVPRNGYTQQRLNTFLEPFDETFSLGMLLIAVEGVLATITVSLAVAAIARVLTATGGVGENLRQSRPSAMDYGRYGKPDVKNDLISEIQKLLGVPATDFDFSDCIASGMAILVGFPGVDPNNFENILAGGVVSFVDVALNLVMSPGYYANFLRMLMSNNGDIVDSFKSISNPFSSNFVSGAGSIFKAIREIVHSKIYKFVMLSAAIGDISQRSFYGIATISEESIMLTKEQSKSIKYATAGVRPNADTAKLRMNISRWGDGTQPLSLKTFYAARKTPTGITVSGGGKSAMRQLDPKREDVEKLENALEAEYMPFYIHDLRTHELISMPAFITEFGENFTANYNAVKGVGRQDAVRLYQDTERAVTLGFMLVATDEDTHDILWDTVNRLVSMCYPQYSAGRQRERKVGDTVTNFIQPFSQVPAASPMVRLRLGDVFKSNYSKFGLTRLFGVNSSAISLKEEKEENLKRMNEDRRIRELEVRIDKRAEFEKIKKSGIPSNFVGLKVDNTSSPAKFKLLAGSTLTNLVSEKKKAISEKISTDIEVSITGITLSDKKHNAYYCLIEYNGVKKNAYFDDIYDFAEEVYVKLVAADPKIKKIDDDLKNLTHVFPDKNFFNPATNAIVRSFETSRGRGVAGFITSIGLDYGNYTWNIKPGSRAPNIVKISLGFVPITDLPLGLDYDGQMRNPSHPVGGISGQFGDVYGDVIDTGGIIEPSKVFDGTWQQKKGGVIYDGNGSEESETKRKDAGPRKK